MNSQRKLILQKATLCLLLIAFCVAVLIPAAGAQSNLAKEKTSTVSDGTVTTKGFDIFCNAYIDIYPDKYSYTKGSYGTVYLKLDNKASDLALSDYTLTLPAGVSYISVYDGRDPDYVTTTSSSTTLRWYYLHTFNSYEEIKIKVKYTKTGSYKIYANDKITDGLSGLTSTDYDKFTVTVA